MATPDDVGNPAPELGVFANRTLNMRSVEAVGYDMDYTLIHYKVNQWEAAAFDAAKVNLARHGWPIESLTFDPHRFAIGLVFDLKLGNVVKATRFGYVVKAQHGNDLLTFSQQRDAYRETVVELSSDRFEFMNTLFELSRASLFAQLVALHDAKPLDGIRTYGELYTAVNDALGEAHLAGVLKAEILADPDRFVDPDPEIVATLLDQRRAGKKLALITNSDWAYTSKMMAWVFDQYCPDDMAWRDLFDVVIVSANKPRFFSAEDPIYRVVDEDESLLLPHSGPLEAGHVYFAGNARLVEESLGVSGGQPLYVGDHLFGDVHVTKDVLRWRTALITRQLESEIRDGIQFDEHQHLLETLMEEKVGVDRRHAQLRLARSKGQGAQVAKELEQVTARAIELDEQIAPLAKEASGLGNAIWGPLMRAGNDKSLYARQVERYADIYMSRVSNLRYETPFAYLRAARGSLPHDPTTHPH
jgi:HAD superfamily 5'-nucleotidase-like hydrolase